MLLLKQVHTTKATGLENRNLSLMTRVQSAGAGGWVPTPSRSSLARGGRAPAPSRRSGDWQGCCGKESPLLFQL